MALRREEKGKGRDSSESNIDVWQRRVGKEERKPRFPMHYQGRLSEDSPQPLPSPSLDDIELRRSNSNLLPDSARGHDANTAFARAMLGLISPNNRNHPGPRHNPNQSPYSLPGYTSAAEDVPPLYHSSSSRPHNLHMTHSANFGSGFGRSNTGISPFVQANIVGNIWSTGKANHCDNNYSPQMPIIGANPSSDQNPKDHILPNFISPHVIDALAIWAQENRSVISEDLERRLRMAGYSPEFDLDEMAPETWLDCYNISLSELQNLKRLLLRRRYVTLDI